jgi:membrane protein YqaA with SNARE-associated domain
MSAPAERFDPAATPRAGRWASMIDRWGPWLLAPCATLEGSVFPAPTEVVFVACAAGGRRPMWWWMTLILAGAAAGTAAGYALGATFGAAMPDAESWPVRVAPYAAAVRDAYRAHPVLALITSGFTPIPFAAYTLVAGASGVSWPMVMAGAVLGRAAKYAVLGGALSAVRATWRHWRA